jgi:alkylation response protein AidB-like acyl-CoA dehydrogenase
MHVNRIFEGTNEINRILIAKLLFKQVFAGSVDSSGDLGDARRILQFTASLAAEKYGESVKDEQEILMHLADMTMEIYAMDSAVSRARKNANKDTDEWMTNTFVSDALSTQRDAIRPQSRMATH